jgi:hypothetical protein
LGLDSGPNPARIGRFPDGAENACVLPSWRDRKTDFKEARHDHEESRRNGESGLLLQHQNLGDGSSPHEGAALPGEAGDRYVRVPAVALLLLGPAMGFFFVVFLPFIGFALVFRELAKRLRPG